MNLLKEIELKTPERLCVLKNIDLIIFDIDKTLVHPTDPLYYKQFSLAIELAIAKHRKIDLKTARQVADHYRSTCGGGEYALLVDNDLEFFPNHPTPGASHQALFNALNTINPDGQFQPNEKLIQLLEDLKNKDIVLVGLSNGVEPVIRRSLLLSGIDADNLFDLFIACTPDSGPPKSIYGPEIFKSITNRFGVDPKNAISIGDSYRHDILPALQAGLHTCLIAENQPGDYQGHSLATVSDLAQIIEF